MLAPLGVIAASLAMLLEAQPEERDRRVAEADAMLARSPTEVVIVGNSKAGSDIDARALADQLDLEGQVVPLGIFGSGMPAWYALLEQRVYGNGHRPRLVVVYGQLGALLHGRAVTDGERRAIAGWSTYPSAVLDREMFRRDPASRVRDRSAAWRSDILDGVRDIAVGLAFPHAPDGYARASLEHLFAEAQTRSTGQARVSPIAEARTAAMTSSDDDPALGYLPDLVRLAHANGARVLVVRAPVSGAARGRDAAATAVEEQLYALVNDLGVSWIDLHELPVPASAFRDDFHMTRAGATILTAALSDAIVKGNVLEGGVLPAVPPFAALEVTRLGELPALSLGVPRLKGGCEWLVAVAAPAELGDDILFAGGLGFSSPVRLEAGGIALSPHATRSLLDGACAGGFAHTGGGLHVSPPSSPPAELRASLDPAVAVEAGHGSHQAWVYPGGALEWRLPSPMGAEVVRVRAHVFAAVGGQAALVVGDRRVAFAPKGRFLEAEIEVATPGLPWSVAIEAGAGTWLAVTQLEVEDASIHRLVGAPFSHTHLFGNIPQFRKREANAAIAAIAGLDLAASGARCVPSALPDGTLDRTCRGKPAFLPVWFLPDDEATLKLSIGQMASHTLGANELAVSFAGFPLDAEQAGAFDIEIHRRNGKALHLVWSRSLDVLPVEGPQRFVLPIDPPLNRVSGHAVVLRARNAAVSLHEATLQESEAADRVP